MRNFKPEVYKGWGKFYKLAEADTFTFYYAELVGLPPHFHRKVSEIFSVRNGVGYLTVYGKPKRRSNKYTADVQKRTKVSKGSMWLLEQNTPIGLEVPNPPLCVHIFVWPRFDSQDEILLKV